MQLKTQQAEFVKSYAVIDGQQRITAIYTVYTDAPHNTPCGVVYYEYLNLTSNVVVKMKEDNSFWDSSWDI